MPIGSDPHRPSEHTPLTDTNICDILEEYTIQVNYSQQ